MDNREFLKNYIRGTEELTEIGIEPYMWLVMGNGEYDKQTVEACLNMQQWYIHEYKTVDRKSIFFEYLYNLRERGYNIERFI